MAAASESTLVLVTGASGYIASHIVKQLQEEGYRVRGTVRSLGDEEKVKKLNELCPEAQYKLELVEADLTKPESWEPAVKDVTYVIHVASPFPTATPKDDEEVVSTAVDGTQNVLKACVSAKSVKRVVMTSSSVAVGYGPGVDMNKTFTEEDWTDPAKLDAHAKSKTLAEKAAWDYVKELPDEDKIELSVINPSYVMGPVLNGSSCTSADVVKRLLERTNSLVPKLNFNIVDVRDVAAAHIKAMTLDEVAGKRVLVTNSNVWMKEIAQVLAKEFKPQGYSVPTMNCPNAVMAVHGWFDKTIKLVIPSLGKVYKFDNTRMKEMLSITPKELKETVVEMAYSLIENGIIKKAKKYKGPNAGGDAEQKAEDEKTEDAKDEEKPKENGEVKDEKKEEEEKKESGEIEPEEKEEKIEDVAKDEEESKPEETTEEAKTEETTEEKPAEEKTEETPAESK